MQWSGGSAEKFSGVQQRSVESVEGEWSVLQWSGVDWTGLYWTGAVWSGLGYSRVQLRGTRRNIVEEQVVHEDDICLVYHRSEFCCTHVPTQ